MEYDITSDILNTASFGPIIGGNYIPRTIFAYNIENGYTKKYSDIPHYTKTTYILKNANLVDCGRYDIIPAFCVYDPTTPNMWFYIPILIKDCICSNTFIFNYTNYLESVTFHKNYTTFVKQDLINICKDNCFFVGA